MPSYNGKIYIVVFNIFIVYIIIDNCKLHIKDTYFHLIGKVRIKMVQMKWNYSKLFGIVIVGLLVSCQSSNVG